MKSIEVDWSLPFVLPSTQRVFHGVQVSQFGDISSVGRQNGKLSSVSSIAFSSLFIGIAIVGENIHICALKFGLPDSFA